LLSPRQCRESHLSQTRVSATGKRVDQSGRFTALSRTCKNTRSSPAIFLPMLADVLKNQWKGDVSVAPTLVFERIAPSEDLGGDNCIFAGAQQSSDQTRHDVHPCHCAKHRALGTERAFLQQKRVAIKGTKDSKQSPRRMRSFSAIASNVQWDRKPFSE